MVISKQTSGELKTRVNSCLTKLSDRDTLSMAANELESIARTLPNDSFAPFLNCLSATDSSEKSPVRRHSVRLLGVLSAAHGDALSPHISRMIATVIRRLRDPDSAVRSACVDAVSSIVTHVNSPPFVAILKPLVDALFHEQDSNVQIGASLCLSAAVEAAPAPAPDAAELRKLLPRVLKLVKSDCFKAKPNLLLFVGSILSTGCAKNKTLLNSVISTAIEFLSSEDWAARKAAAEVLDKAAASERNLTAEFKSSSIAALESRRFDKVKIVRETMNRALETWKSLPVQHGHVSLSQETGTGADSPGSPGSIVLETPKPGKTFQAKSPPSISPTNSQKAITKLNLDNRQCVSSKMNLNRNSRSRVVPFNCNDNSSESQDYEDLSVIRKHLQQIENQQSNLLDLLQRFIGSSQKGMSSLERRVDGLEKVLDEMSDFAMSTRRVPGPDCGGNICCMIPGAEFLSPKFWRRAEGQTCNNSRLNSSYTNLSGQGMLQRDAMAEVAKIGSPGDY